MAPTFDNDIYRECNMHAFL